MVEAEKRLLRQDMARRLASMAPARRALEEELVTAAIQDTAEWRAARTILLYRSVAPEFSTVGLANAAWRAGRRVVFPKVGPQGLTLHAVASWTELRPGYQGIPEPDGPAVDPGTVDVAVVPGVAFTRDGGRLGRGGGFFDRLIPALRGSVWAVAFDIQVVGGLPRAAHDVPVQRVWHAALLMDKKP